MYQTEYHNKPHIPIIQLQQLSTHGQLHFHFSFSYLLSPSLDYFEANLRHYTFSSINSSVDISKRKGLLYLYIIIPKN